MSFWFNPFLIPIVGILAYALWKIVDIISSAWTSASQHRADVELKMAMVQRGMSADEIERVIRSGRGHEKGAPGESLYSTQPVPPQKRPSAVV